MEGLESMCALTSVFRRLTGVIETGISCGLLGLEGSRPLRPFKLAVLTTAKIYIGYTHRTTYEATSLNLKEIVLGRVNKTEKVLDITFLHHPYDHALLKTAILASVSPSFIHRTVFVCQTNVFGVFLHRALQRNSTSMWRINCM